MNTLSDFGFDETKFSDNARQICDLARKEALKSKVVRPEHILFAVLKCKQEIVVRALARMGLTLSVARYQIKKIRATHGTAVDARRVVSIANLHAGDYFGVSDFLYALFLTKCRAILALFKLHKITKKTLEREIKRVMVEAGYALKKHEL